MLNNNNNRNKLKPICHLYDITNKYIWILNIIKSINKHISNMRWTFGYIVNKLWYLHVGSIFKQYINLNLFVLKWYHKISVTHIWYIFFNIYNFKFFKFLTIYFFLRYLIFSYTDVNLSILLCLICISLGWVT